MRKLLASFVLLGCCLWSGLSFGQAQPPVMLWCYVAGSNPARAVPCTDPSATPINVNGGGGTVTNPSVNKICDPTTPTICLNVKGASTAAVATDQSGVFQLNPLSPGIIAPAVPGAPNIVQVVTVQGAASMAALSVKLQGSSAAADGITPIASASAVASQVLKNAPGNFYSGSAVNATATAGFCLVVNATSAPTTGSSVTPLAFAVLPASGQCSIGSDAGIPSVFSTGIVFLVSSNSSPYTFTTGSITAAISGKVQ